MNNSLNIALTKVARKLSVDPKIVDSVYRSYWKFIKEHISSMTLEDMTQEEFDSVDTNFSLPYIGKLYVDYEKIIRYNNYKKYIENVKAEKSKANRMPSISD